LLRIGGDVLVFGDLREFGPGFPFRGFDFNPSVSNQSDNLTNMEAMKNPNVVIDGMRYLEEWIFG